MKPGGLGGRLEGYGEGVVMSFSMSWPNEGRRARPLGIAILVIFFLFLFFIFSNLHLARAATQYTITDDATGGNCTAVGTWDPATKTCTLTTDIVVPAGSNTGIMITSKDVTLDGNGHSVSGSGSGLGVYAAAYDGNVTIKNTVIQNLGTGIEMVTASNGCIAENNSVSNSGTGITAGETTNYHIIRGNSLTANATGINLLSSGYNQVEGNSITGNSTGIYIDYYSFANIITDNTISGNSNGVYIGTFSSGNEVYRNNFLNNSVQAQAYSATTFTKPSPMGGNYWNNWTAPDGNGDGFVDNPYIFSGGTDNLPWAVANGWELVSIAPTAESVLPSGIINSSATQITVSYSDNSGTGINTSSVSVTLDGSPLTGCSVSSTSASCPVSGLINGSYTIGGSLADNAGNTTAFAGGFSVQLPSGYYVIRDNATGGDCNVIGAWDVDTKTCTMSTDIRSFQTGSYHTNPGISIADNGITLDGNGFSIIGGGWDYGQAGIQVSGRDEITVRDISVNFLYTGISVANSTGIRIEGSHFDVDLVGIDLNLVQNAILSGNTSQGCQDAGIDLNQSSNVSVTGNNVSGATNGINLTGSDNNTLSNNSASAEGNGINLTDSNGNIINGNQVGGGWIGVAIGNSTGNTARSNHVANTFIAGIGLSGSSGNTIVANDTSGNELSGIDLTNSSNNLIEENIANGNTVGLYVKNASSSNTIVRNTMKWNSCGLCYYGGTTGNTAYHNVFVENGEQANNQDGSSNVFNIALPAGGNYWSDWVAPDSDGDGIVDTPYMFSGGQDNLPWATLGGWLAGKPALSIGSATPYWSSYQSFLARELSVDWTLSNTGTNATRQIRLTGSSNTNGVSLAMTLPIDVGDLAQGATMNLSLKYNIPVGVGAWNTRMTATASDPLGTSYTYP